MNREIRILIADDHLLLRLGLRQIIEKNPNLKIIAEAEDGQEALALIQKEKPEIAILDIQMPQMDGFEVARRGRL